jgi:hypothetical protein
LNCSEQVIVKGDKRIERIRHRYREVKRLREEAEEEIAAGTAGADRWYETHSLTESRLEELLPILLDPEIPDGALVRLRNDNEFSPLRRAVEAKSDREMADNEGQSLLGDLRALLGGRNGETSER